MLKGKEYVPVDILGDTHKKEKETNETNGSSCVGLNRVQLTEKVKLEDFGKREGRNFTETTKDRNILIGKFLYNRNTLILFKRTFTRTI